MYDKGSNIFRTVVSEVSYFLVNPVYKDMYKLMIIKYWKDVGRTGRDVSSFIYQ